MTRLGLAYGSGAMLLLAIQLLFRWSYFSLDLHACGVHLLVSFVVLHRQHLTKVFFCFNNIKLIE